MNQNQRNEQQLADQAVNLLESTGGRLVSNDDHQNFELGRLIRESAKIDFPNVNPELRKQLLDQLETFEGNKVDLPPAAPMVSYGQSAWKWAFAAGLMLAMGAWAMYQMNGRPVQTAGGMSLKYQIEDQAAFEPADAPVAAIDKEELLASNGSLPKVTIHTYDGDNLSTTEIVLPELSETIVGRNKVVNVPDSGTVLLGGVKRFEETRAVDQLASLQGQSSSEGQEKVANVARISNEFMNRASRSRSEYFLGVRLGKSASGQQNIAGQSGEIGQLARGYGFGEGEGQFGIGGGGGGFAGGGRRLYFKRQNNTEQYAPIHENKFIAAVGGDAISTFSIDVDTASYANMRRFINSGQMPPRDSIRIEELVNYFKYDYPQPVGDDPFSVNMELASCPWNNNHKILRVGLKGKDIHVDERPPTSLVFLLDVSGSMTSEDKLPLLKRGFQMMVNKLTENDRVSIVTYAGNAGVALEPTSGDQTKKINEAIERLTPGGSTHGSAGIELAYQLAQKHFIKDGVNKVILATDGDLNVGITDDDALVKLIKNKASEGVFLTVLGFGTGNLKDAKMEKLADNGNGMYAYIDSIREAHKVLVEQMSGSLVTIAKDVKIQIEFNPAEVQAYRLIGYENRILATEDFDNDRKDAGEIGAGHTVTALYELVMVDNTNEFTDATPKGLKYQSQATAQVNEQPAVKANLSAAAKSGELLTLALRYKQPDSNTSKRIEFTIVNDEKSFSSASADFRFATSVASFGMLIRGSEHAGESNPAMIQEIAAAAMGDDSSGYRAEFIDLVRKVGTLCD